MRIFLVFILTVVLSCQNDENIIVTRAFYHWKQDLSLTDYEKQRLFNLGIKRLYVRFFDVDLQQGKPVPLSILSHQRDLSMIDEIIPVVFITNRTFLKIDQLEIAVLANQVVEKIRTLAAPLQQEIYEVQIDCDWSGKTRAAYFDFLCQVKKRLEEKGTKLSATIRLHQVKYYQQTGVPEVDRGVLMFYNTGTVDDPKTTNSILDLTTARNYLYQFEEYPLALDVALPIFKWGVVFQDDRFVRLINGLDDKLLKDSTQFSKVTENQFELRKSMYLEGYYLYKGDRIRVEEISAEVLKESTDLLNQVISRTDRSIIFYHIDSSLIVDYPDEVLENIYRAFD